MTTDIMAPVEFDSTLGNTRSELQTAAQSMRYRAAIFSVSRQTADDVISAIENVPIAVGSDHGPGIVDHLDADWLLFTKTIDDTTPSNPEDLRRAIEDRARFQVETDHLREETRMVCCSFEREWSIYGNNAGVEPQPAILEDAIKCIRRLNTKDEPPWRQYLWSDDLEKYIWPQLSLSRNYDTTQVGVMLTLLCRVGLMGRKKRSNKTQFWYGENVDILESLKEYLELRPSLEFELPLGDSSLRFG